MIKLYSTQLQFLVFSYFPFLPNRQECPNILVHTLSSYPASAKVILSEYLVFSVTPADNLELQ